MKSTCFLQILTLIFYFKCRCQEQPGDWKYAGPHQTTEQVKGLIKAVWGDENDPSFLLAGSSSGGLFRTQNSTSSQPEWKNISDSYNGINFGVSDIVVMPNTSNKTIFIATGHNSGLPTGYGNGILKTIDGGDSWQETGPKAVRKNLFMMEGLVANKQNPSEMVAYTAKEVFFTKDQWISYEKIKLPIDTTNAGISFCDVEFAPFEPGKFYVCTRTYNFYDSQLFVCENYGKKITDITPKDIKSERIELATINNEKYKGKFYIVLGAGDVYAKYFNGKTFTTLNVTPVNQTFGGAYWNLEFAVNQVDTNVMYICLTEISRSTNGGKSFEKIGVYNGHNTHADVRAICLVKNSKGCKDDLFYVANDGGISLLDTTRQISWKSLNGVGLDANQFWGADVAQSDTLLIAGGVQDNGGFLITEHGNENTMGNCGDGYYGLVLDEHSAIIECNAPSMFYHNIKTHQIQYLQINDSKYETKRPLSQTDSFVYVGFHDIWQIGKRDLKNGSSQFNYTTRFPYIKAESGNIKNAAMKCMSFGKYNTAVVAYCIPTWSEKENIGKVFFCNDVKDNIGLWTDITELLNFNTLEICRWTEVTSVEMDLNEPNKFHFIAKDLFDQTNSLVFSIHYYPDSNKAVLKKLNRNLPKIGFNKIITDKFSGITYLACDDGVYYSSLNADSVKWTKLNADKNKLPSVMVSDIAFNYMSNTLVAATYGRGVWQTRPVNSLTHELKINSDRTEDKPIKVDGRLIVGRKKTYTINSKLIITKGSAVELKNGSTVVIKNKSLVRDENNKLIDLDFYIKKSKRAKVIYR